MALLFPLLTSYLRHTFRTYRSKCRNRKAFPEWETRAPQYQGEVSGSLIIEKLSRSLEMK